MKIIHLSDTHLGKGSNAARWQAIMNDLQQSELELTDCILIHTGDLIESGTPEYRQTGLTVLEQTRPLFRQVLLAPGNHDCGNSARVSAAAHSQFLNQYKDYLFASDKSFPALHLIENDYAFIGLDSNAGELCLFKSLLAEGEIGKDQLDRLEKLLDSEALKDRKIILYLHHHPFNFPFKWQNLFSFNPAIFNPRKWKAMMINLTTPFRRLKDADQLIDCIRGRVDVVLFGHKHEGLNCTFASRKYRIPLALDAGSSTQTDNFRQHPNSLAPMRYRIIDLETMQWEEKQVEIDKSLISEE